MISFTHSRLYKDIGSKAFFTMVTLLMPLLENEEIRYFKTDALTIFIGTETFLSYKYKKRPKKQGAGARMFKTSLKPFTMQGRASRLHYYLIPGIRSKFAPNRRHIKKTICIR